MRFKIVLIVLLVSFIGSACNLSTNVTYDDLNEIVLHYEEKYAYLLENRHTFAPEIEKLPVNKAEDAKGEGREIKVITASGGASYQSTDEEIIIMNIDLMRHELDSTPPDQLKKDMLDKYIERIKLIESKRK